MHRVLGHHDTVPLHIELHGTSIGVSFGIPWVFDFVNPGGRLVGSSKIGDTVELPTGSPMGLGHDGGPLRIHLLKDIAKPPNSLCASLVATATSGIEPHFSAHKVQINVDGAMLPVVGDPTPCSVGAGAATLCGAPDTPSLFLVPFHLSVYMGMTIGDIIGGLVNYYTEAYWSLAMECIGQVLGLIHPALSIIFGIGCRYQSLLIDSFNLGPSNVGVPVQQRIDGDGIGHDADATLGIGTIGYLNYDAQTGDVSAEMGPLPETLLVAAAFVSLTNPVFLPFAMAAAGGYGAYRMWE